MLTNVFPTYLVTLGGTEIYGKIPSEIGLLKNLTKLDLGKYSYADIPIQCPIGTLCFSNQPN